MKGNNRH